MTSGPGTGRMAGDEIQLRLPGDPAYGRLARIAATSLARRLGFTFRQIEDLGLAVDEAVILLHQPASGTVEGIDVRLHVVDRGIALAAQALPRPTPAAPVAPLDDPAVTRFERLVEGTVAAWSVDAAVRSVTLEARPG